eukprot:TRINITY_DN1236_c0_g1_i6.p1 TRINITY_DN1236_c0_g1~~TRINITY_DN1236_c0_g1_i6.p1  ORF type:complete len:490 (-),score=60.11 TRINITY_DN1236_c0_g1_i6:12-1481(-)
MSCESCLLPAWRGDNVTSYWDSATSTCWTNNGTQTLNATDLQDLASCPELQCNLSKIFIWNPLICNTQIFAVALLGFLLLNIGSMIAAYMFGRKMMTSQQLHKYADARQFSNCRDILFRNCDMNVMMWCLSFAIWTLADLISSNNSIFYYIWGFLGVGLSMDLFHFWLVFLVIRSKTPTSPTEADAIALLRSDNSEDSTSRALGQTVSISSKRLQNIMRQQLYNNERILWVDEKLLRRSISTWTLPMLFAFIEMILAAAVAGVIITHTVEMRAAVATLGLCVILPISVHLKVLWNFEYYVLTDRRAICITNLHFGQYKVQCIDLHSVQKIVCSLRGTFGAEIIFSSDPSLAPVTQQKEKADRGQFLSVSFAATSEERWFDLENVLSLNLRLSDVTNVATRPNPLAHLQVIYWVYRGLAISNVVMGFFAGIFIAVVVRKSPGFPVYLTLAINMVVFSVAALPLLWNMHELLRPVRKVLSTSDVSNTPEAQ